MFFLKKPFLVLNYSCVFGKRNYRVLVRVCLCVCVCFCTITQKEIDLGTRNRNTLWYMKITRTSSILSLVGSRSKVTVGVQKFSPFTTIQTVRSYSSTLVQARNFILSMYLHLILIYKIYECRHA